MKKTLVLSMVLAMLSFCACGAPAGDKEEASSAPVPTLPQVEAPSDDVIMASALISLEQAEDTLGVSLEEIAADEEVPPGAIKCAYDSGDTMLQIFIT